jgi:hypothetical protein
MAMNFHSKRKRRKIDTARVAEQLAPLEEQKEQSTRGNQSDGANHEHGAIVVDSQRMNLPKGVDDEEETKSGIEPVVLVIMGLLLGYIVFIAWQISQMPAP